ncbi:MAG: ATP-binding protein [Chroococcales cyanobacterium]
MSTCDQTNGQLNVLKTIYTEMPTDLDALEEILAWFDQINESFIPRKTWLQCQLALVEGFTNAVRHAHKNLSPDVPIQLKAKLNAQSIEIQIYDRGNPFNLQDYLDKVHFCDNETGSGRGLPILEKITDYLSYNRTEDDRNCLIIVKHYFPIN